MSSLTSSLQIIGLSSNEARIYEACLKQEDSTVAYLSRILAMNRTTTYHYIHELEKKGLLTKRIENGKVIISAVKEEGLQAYLDYEESQFQERKNAIKNIVKKLPKTKKHQDDHDVEYFSGFDGIKLALEKAFRARSKHWDIIAPKKNFFSEVEESYAIYFLEQRKKRKITARSLWEKTDDGSKLSPGGDRLSHEIIKERNPRYLPKKYNNTFHAVTILFDSSVLYVSSKNEMQAVLINSSDIVSSLTMQFNIIWENSEEAGMLRK